jgi:2-polyprenyl-6-methoxyphenol hydroxylase-like FAD-dependent oxidoreductase
VSQPRVDVVVVGGGPAGTAAAIFLGRQGYSVRLFEARPLPLDKPCGEGIMPAGAAVLDRLGLRAAVGGRDVHGVRYHGFGRTVEASFARAGVSPGLAQRRRVLDAALWRAASETPGVLLEERSPVDGVIASGGRVVGVRVRGREQRCRLVVAADGASSRVRQLLGLDGRTLRRARAGVRAHYALAPSARAEPGRMIEVYLGDGRELYTTPLPGHELLVAVLGAPSALRGGRAGFDALVRDEPHLSARVAPSPGGESWRGRAGLGHVARAGWRPGAVLLGDAAFTLDPLTANGISQALVSAEMLAQHAEALLSGDGGLADRALAAFERRRWREARSRVHLTKILVGLVRRRLLARGTLALMQGAPRLLHLLLAIAAGTSPLGGPVGHHDGTERPR